MGRERILVTVKTYPTLSRKYGETVCTAGVREDGSWVRIYPVPFRRLDEKQQYSKFDWLECDLHPSKKDPRPETFHPSDISQLRPVDHIGTENKWRERRRILLETTPVYTNLQRLIDGAKTNKMSLAVFKPKRVLGFSWEEEERDWEPTRLEQMRRQSNQGLLFEEEAWRKTFKVIPKLPYSFSYEFEDDEGKRSKLQILDWEIGALYWKCLRKAEKNEEEALEKVRIKYEDQFLERDIHLFLGTTQQFHFVAPNPWVIIGVFPIPYDRQMSLI
ncbi:MAG: hypothetical protein D6820_00940 [Lentisphaerae bacterium]|nr:MAG: hypothetical protein D6820_00940 [Lentisphaerota bacterium]